MPAHRLIVPEGAAIRADRFLAASLPGLSRRRVQQLLAEGRIRVAGKRIPKGAQLVGGIEVLVEIAELATGLRPEPDAEVRILYEDPQVLVLDKPAGRPAHALRADDEGTIANFLAGRYPECRETSDRALDAGLVHRLDTETSGVLLAARTRAAWRALRRQFRDREVEKRYLALVAGRVAGPGEIDRAIGSDPKNRRRVRVASGAGPGRPAITRYRPLRDLRNATLLEIEIPTGARHQIRAHLAAEDHPVLGDALYGGPPAPAGVRRHLLHAGSIAFTHPETGLRVRIESPLPADFAAALHSLR